MRFARRRGGLDDARELRRELHQRQVFRIKAGQIDAVAHDPRLAPRAA